jgi:hypothetical protein
MFDDEVDDGMDREWVNEEWPRNKPVEEPVEEPVVTPPSADLVAFKAQLRPLMATVLSCARSGHPHMSRHLAALSDLINQD